MPCCARCCHRATGMCRSALEPCLSMLRVLENVPGVGHVIAAFYACATNKDKAERAGIKATIGICFCVCNCPAELVDEIVRYRSEKLWSFGLSARADWMRRFSNRTLKNLCLPASHQTSTWHMDSKLKPIPTVEGWSSCQRMHVDAQLYGGVRFFDLRLMDHKNDVWTHHNLVVCERLSDILCIVKDFITENSSEIICLYMTNDGKSLDWGRVHSLLQEYFSDSMIPEHQKDMPIGEFKMPQKLLGEVINTSTGVYIKDDNCSYYEYCQPKWKKKIAINWWQDPSAVGSVHQYQEIMRKNDPPLPPCQFFLNGCGSHFVFNGFTPKVNQTIRNT